MVCSFLVWNSQGAVSASFRRTLKSFIQRYHPDVIVLVEPRISGVTADRVIKQIGYPNSHRIEASGFSGDLWLLWKDPLVVSPLVNHKQFVHVEILNTDLNRACLFTGVYGSPNPIMRTLLWTHLGKLADSAKLPWLLAGNFNTTLHPSERSRGAQSMKAGCRHFQELMLNSGLIDLGYIGPNFTWRRGSTLVRLDRALCNNTWIEDYPNTTVMHLPKIQSDHRPMFIRSAAVGPLNERPFRYLAAWALHPDFERLVRET